MTVHNQLHRGPLGKALKGALGDQSTDGNLERYGETLTPNIDLWSMPEWAFLRTERLAGGTFDVLGAAGTIPEVLLYNPAASKVLVVVMHLRWLWTTSLGNAFFYRLYRGAALPGGFDLTVRPAGPLDTRDPKLIAAGSTQAVLAQATNVAVAGGNPFDEIVNLVNTPESFVDPVILAPGTGFAFGPQVVGVQRFLGGIKWRERVAFQSELGF